MSGADIFDVTSKELFNREHHHVRIRLHQAVFDKVLKDGAEDVDSGYGLVDEFLLDDYAISNVGIKVRGNTSAANVKRQFKFKFDATKVFKWQDGAIADVELDPDNDDRRFLGEQGFSVRASQNDPARIREMLSGKVFREAFTGDEDPQRPWRTRGGLVYRAAFGTLYVTNGRRVEEGYDPNNPGYRVKYGDYLYDPKGLYVITENIDKTFLKTRFERFPNEKIKCYLFQADKGRAHFTKEEYTRVGWKLELAKGKNAKDEDDFAKGDEKMGHLIDLLASNPSEDQIRETLDMDSVNGYLAAALLCTHWDSLAANRNNDFMMYWKRDVLDDQMQPVPDTTPGREGEDKKEAKWYMITWDLDNTLWDKYGESSDVRNPYKNWFSNYIYQPAKKDQCKAKLFDVVYGENNKKVRAVYDQVLRDMLAGYYSKKEYDETVEELKERVSKAIEDTKKAVASAGWQQNWGETCNHRDFEDIKDHADDRRHPIGSQLD
ncbi:unnamed protein product [Chondrus crispus]|uniref:Spore coat protein CotH n=1 Tax=Chondrus crispus TaxID=2769 RepID=R7QK28_CHOCR|nr:unnamed protein product [Chondrus crispus]CDF37831.1 unnamed protein product [Chondrus crispus]|eukprot:XP_005717702.1 unnamed protein product [Chondrus crispus]